MSRVQVLALYKRLLRRADRLVFTDKDYYRLRVRLEFLKNKAVGDPQKLARLIEKGEKLLELDRFI